MSLQNLLSKRVICADGTCLGHLYGFRARCEGPDILITHIQVGWAVWIERLHMRSLMGRVFNSSHALEIPWEAIESVDKEVHLKPGWDKVQCDGCRMVKT